MDNVKMVNFYTDFNMAKRVNRLNEYVLNR